MPDRLRQPPRRRGTPSGSAVALSPVSMRIFVSVGSGIEVPAHHRRVATVVSARRWKPAGLRLWDLSLAKWVVQHHGEELDGPAVASDREGQHLSHSRIIVSSVTLDVRLCRAASGKPYNAETPISALVRVTGEHVMSHAQPPAMGLLRYVISALNHDSIKQGSLNSSRPTIFNRRLSLLPLPVSAPYVPRHDPRVDWTSTTEPSAHARSKLICPVCPL